MLDSGAFSAWTKKTLIDIEQYGDFCFENQDYFESIVNLDVIPGEFGKKDLGEKEVERSASLGWKNYQYMLKRGIPQEKLIHVFHQGENFKWLEVFIKEKVSYIGLSPGNDRTTQEKIYWFDRCMNYVCDNEGIPIVKFHGFGIGSVEIIIRYPFFSVDSTTWVLTSRFGSVFVPMGKGGKYDYNVAPLKIAVSAHSPSKKDEGEHFDSLSPTLKKNVLDYFELKGYKLGKTEVKKVLLGYALSENERWIKKEKGVVEIVIEPGLSNQYVQRDEMNILYFLDLESNLPQWPWAFKRKINRLFSK